MEKIETSLIQNVKENQLICFSLPLGMYSLQEMDTIFYKNVAKTTKFWICENAKILRRFLSSMQLNIAINELQIIQWDKHNNSQNEVFSFIKEKITQGNIGLVSDCGTPCIADPGSIAIAFAHKNNIMVNPLIGPNSILLCLMASGFNGQNFTFNGYLPITETDKIAKLNQMATLVMNQNTTQIFIETPYRNKQLFDTIITKLNSQCYLCIAYDLHGENQQIIAKPILKWKENPFIFEKKPAIFALGVPV